MSTNATDSIEQARAAEQAGIDQLREARARHAAQLADRDQLEAGHRAELAALEAEFAEAETRRLHLERVTAARDTFNAATKTYLAAEKEADDLVTRVHTLTAELADMFAAAVTAEIARITAGTTLRHAHGPLAQLEPGLAEPPVAPARLHQRDQHSPLLGAQHIAVVVHPDVEPKLRQLAQRQSNHYSPKPPMPNLIVR